MNCLLIGGAGFIGKNLAFHLAKNGHNIMVYDCIESPFLSSREMRIQYIKGDYFRNVISDEVIMRQDIIFLLACSVGPKTSMDNPEICYGQDIVRMIQLLEQMITHDVSKLFFISSGGTVYGNSDVETFSEDMETLPINHYGIMKLTQEKILLMYNNLYGMKNIIFRLSNPYGCGQKVSSGIGAVTAFMNQICREEKISVYGKGEVIRDYIYIDDVVEMIRLFLERGRFESVNPVFNIGTGVGTSIIELVRIIERITGKNADIEFKESRKIDVNKNVLNNKKIKTIIGEYKCSSLMAGISEYYNMIERGMDNIG